MLYNSRGRFSVKKILSIAALCFATPFILSGCSSTSKTYDLPDKDDYQGYKIIDGVDKDTVSVKIDKNEKIAVVIRDISTTAYSYLEPRYTNAMVTYE
jgi:hypothetical protein